MLINSQVEAGNGVILQAADRIQRIGRVGEKVGPVCLKSYRLRDLPARTLDEDREHQPSRTAQSRDQAGFRCHRHAPQRRRHRPARWRADAGAQRGTGCRSAIYVASNSRPRHRQSQSQAARRSRLITARTSSRVGAPIPFVGELSATMVPHRTKVQWQSITVAQLRSGVATRPFIRALQSTMFSRAN